MVLVVAVPIIWGVDTHSLNLIQIGMRVEVGQGSGVRPRVRIVVVDGKSLEVPHVLDLRGQGTGELILGELVRRVSAKGDGGEGGGRRGGGGGDGDGGK